jgi:hypothetical protein
MVSYMTNNEAIKTIISYNTTDSLANECAVSMCLIDVASYGVDEWVTWSSQTVIEIFRNTADEVLDEIMDEVESRSAGEDIIDELLGTAQTERIDYKQALVGMKEGSIRYFKALALYTEIHEDVKGKYYLEC